MYRPITPFLHLALTSILVSAPSWSQSPTVVATAKQPAETSPPPSPKDLEEARDLVRADRLYRKQLDWKEKGASVAEIVAHLRQSLGKDVSPEVRGKDTNLSTFELTQAPLGPTLSAVASLADAKLWVFPGRLLVAPENLLTPKEQAIIKSGTSGEWLDSSTAGGRRWNAIERFQFIAVTLVGTDLKERFAAKGLTPVSPPPPTPTTTPSVTPLRGGATYVRGSATPSTEPPLAYELPLRDLSPASQKIVQDLADAEWERTQVFRRPSRPDATNPPEKPPVLDTTTIVSFDDVQGSQLQLRLQKTDPADTTKRKDLNRWYVSKPPSPLP